MRIVLTVIVFALLVVHGEKAEAQTTRDAGKTNQPPHQTVTVVNQQAPDGEQDDHTKKSPSYLSRLFSPENLPNITLVVVAAITAIFILGQSREMKRATKAMQDAIPLQKTAADAALLNAQAVINAERPWVMVEKIDVPYLEPWEMPPRTKPDDLPPPQPQTGLRLSHCMFYLKNFGNTPAKLTAWRYELLIGDSWVAPPDTDLWEHEGRNISPYAIAANGILAQPAELVGGVVAIKQRDELLVSRVKTLWLCGIIHYLDVFGKPHKTTFCWQYQTHMNTPEPFWQLGGEWKYNETT